MPQSFWKIVLGLLLALLAAASLATLTGLPLAGRGGGTGGFSQLLGALLPIAAYALPGALAAIFLAEARHVRGLLYYLFVGVLIATLGFLLLTRAGSLMREVFQSVLSFRKFFAMGLAGGWIYWLVAGKNAGRLAADFARVHDGSLTETAARKRCRSCTALGLLLGFIPLALLGWYSFYSSNTKGVPAIRAKAEADASKWLAEAGLKDTGLVIDDRIGHVVGNAPDLLSKAAAFEKAKVVLGRMVGKPGVVEKLQDDIVIVNSGPEPAPKGDEAEAKRKEAEDAAAARAKADELKRLAEEKRKSDDEAAAKMKADAQARQAAEAVEAKAEEDRRAAAEARKKAEAEAAAKAKAQEEAAAKAKTEEDARLEAEAIKKKTEEDAQAALEKAKAEEALKATEAKKKAEEEATAAKKKAEQDARLAAEAAAERQAVEAAYKAAEVAKKAEAAVPSPPPAAPPSPPDGTAKCASDFSDLFRSFEIRFALNSAELGDDSSDFLNRVSDLARRCPGLAITVDGHTDRRGNLATNEILSRARADVVRNALISRGLDNDRVVASGYASERPFAPENSQAAYGLNRRVALGTKPYTPAKAADVNDAAGKTKIEKSSEASPPYAPPEPEPRPMAANLCPGEFSRLFLSSVVRFVARSAEIDATQNDFLDKVADLALRCPSFTLYVNGHTDRRGAASVNQELSAARAHAVRDALAAREVPENRIIARGYGAERPFDPANTPEAYALNRRVDFGAIEKSPSQ